MLSIFSLLKDLVDYVALKIQTIGTNTTTVGEILDLLNVDRVLFTCFQGTITDGDYDYTLYAGDAANMVGEELVDEAVHCIGTLPAYTGDTDDDKTAVCEYIPYKRYCRLKVVSLNTSSGGVMGAVVHKHPVRLPGQTS